MNSSDPKIDLGLGVTAEVRRIDGVPDGVAYWHTCNDLPEKPDFVPLKPEWPDGWDLVSLEPLTLSPSLLCFRCQKHGFIQNGKWVPA